MKSTSWVLSQDAASRLQVAVTHFLKLLGQFIGAWIATDALAAKESRSEIACAAFSSLKLDVIAAFCEQIFLEVRTLWASNVSGEDAYFYDPDIILPNALTGIPVGAPGRQV